MDDGLKKTAARIVEEKGWVLWVIPDAWVELSRSQEPTSTDTSCKPKKNSLPSASVSR